MTRSFLHQQGLMEGRNPLTGMAHFVAPEPIETARPLAPMASVPANLLDDAAAMLRTPGAWSSSARHDLARRIDDAAREAEE